VNTAPIRALPSLAAHKAASGTPPQFCRVQTSLRATAVPDLHFFALLCASPVPGDGAYVRPSPRLLLGGGRAVRAAPFFMPAVVAPLAARVSLKVLRTLRLLA